MVRETRLHRTARDQRARELGREMSGTERRLPYRLRCRQMRGLTVLARLLIDGLIAPPSAFKTGPQEP